MVHRIFQKMRRDKKSDHEHNEGNTKAGTKEPPASQSDEKDRGYHSSHRCEDTQKEAPRLEVQETLLSLNISRMDPDT